MNNQKRKLYLERHSERGLTALELVVSMVIFLVVVAAVYGILQMANKSRSSINSRSENIKNVRMAINSIGREAVNAGLGYNRIGGVVPDDFATDNFGLPADADEEDDLLTAITAGYNISETDFSKNGEKNDVVAFAFRDFQFNDGFPIVINDVDESKDDLVLKTPSGACANCRPYDLFLIESGDGRKAIVLSTDIVNGDSIVLGDDPLSTNYGKKNKGTSGKKEKSKVKKCKPGKTEDCIDFSSTTIVAKKIYLVSYNVSADGTLIRTTFGNNPSGNIDEQIIKQPIANGVHGFKVSYLLTDGTSTTDPSASGTQNQKNNEIIQIDVTVTVDSEKGTEPITLNSTFSTRNLKYDVY